MEDKIIKIIGETLNITVDQTVSQHNCEKWDSLRHLNIVVALEEAFDVSFEPEDMARMKSVKNIAEILTGYLN